MRRNREKTDKQRQAALLLQKMVFLETKKCLSMGIYTDYRGKPIHRKFFLCNINGERYVRASDVNYRFAEKIPKLIKDGILQSSDCRRAGCSGKKVGFFVRGDAVISNRNIIVDMADQYSQNYTKDVIDSLNEQTDIPDNFFSKDDFIQSDKKYAEYLRLQNENRRELSNEENQEEQDVFLEEKKKELTLAELVDCIEQMGWEVTLKRK